LGTENVQNIFLVNHSSANHTDYWIIDSREDWVHKTGIDPLILI